MQRYEQRNMYVLLDNKNEALLPFSEQVPRENYRINDRIRAYVLDVRKTNKGPLVVLSRAAEGLVQRLIEFQVPEIQDDIVEIMAIAREPGSPHESRGALAAARGRRRRRVPGTEVVAHRQRFRRTARREDRRHQLGARSAAVHQNALAPAKVLGVELFEDEGVALVDRPRLPAFARDRPRRAERPAGCALDRLAPRYHQRSRGGRGARALPGRARRARTGRSRGGTVEEKRSHPLRREAADGRPTIDAESAAPARRVQARDVRDVECRARSGSHVRRLPRAVPQATLRRFVRRGEGWVARPRPPGPMGEEHICALANAPSALRRINDSWG